MKTLHLTVMLHEQPSSEESPHDGRNWPGACATPQPRLSPSIEAGSHSGFVMRNAAAARGVVWLLVSGGADPVDELCPSGFESSAVTGDRWLGEFGGCEL